MTYASGLYAAFTPLVDTLADRLGGVLSMLTRRWRRWRQRRGGGGGGGNNLSDEDNSGAYVGGLSAMAFIGINFCALGHVLFGPSPLLGFPEGTLRGWRLWALEAVGGATAYGMGSAFAFVPLLPIMQASVADLGVESAEMTTGFFNSLYYCGELLGQLFGAQLVDLMGFPVASTCFAAALLGSCAVFVAVRLCVKLPMPY